jgi:hypothetical protein
MTKPINYPIFIVGMPRSGTTLLSNMMNVLDNIYFPSETHFFIQKKRYESRSNFFKKKISFGEFYFSKNRFYNRSLIVSNQLINDFNSLNSDKEKFEFILKIKGRKQNLGIHEKTPIHLECINEIKIIYPDAKFILIVRDPRDIFNSLKQVKWSFFFPYKLRINSYKKMVTVDKIKNVYTVKYEELIQNPKNILFNLCNFLKINFNESMYTDFNKKKFQNFKIQDEPWKSNNTNNLDSSNIYKWKKSKNDLTKYISYILRNEINYFGYEQYNSKIKSWLFLKFFFLTFLSDRLIKLKNIHLLSIIFKNY